jgi:hypothetical protein
MEKKSKSANGKKSKSANRKRKKIKKDLKPKDFFNFLLGYMGIYFYWG